MSIIQCPACGVVTDDSAKQFCGQCGAALHGKAAPTTTPAKVRQTPKPTGTTGAAITTIIALAVALIVGVGACMACNSGSRSDEPDFTLTATELSAAYEQNEVAADQMYEGKTLRVTGTVYDISSLSNSIELEAPSNVLCYMEDGEKSAMAGLADGEQVTITGVCSGKLGWILVENCVLQ